MCSVVLCARIGIRDALCRQIVPLCLTSHREKHIKTRAIFRRVKPIQVVGKSSEPHPQYKKHFEADFTNENFDEEEYCNPLLDVKSADDVRSYLKEVRSEFDERARRLKRLLERKELVPLPKESNLLHWSARQQIRYLHKQKPLDWTPEKIADEFPISVHGAKRLLRNNRRISEDQIEAFNKEVDARWKLLRKIRREGKVPETGPVHLHEKTIELFLENKLQSESLKAGSPEFPQPPPLFDIKVPYPVGKEGKHFAILQEYKNLLETKSQENDHQVTTKVESYPDALPTLEKYREIGDDPEAASHLDLPPRLRRKLDLTRSTENVTFEDFKAKERIDDQVRLEGKKESKKVVRKKKLNNSETPWARPEKFKEAPPRTRRYEESDGTYSVGRNVFSSDGEILYRKSNY